MSRLYVGNLSNETTEELLREALSRDGRTVTLIKIKKSGRTGKSRGFAFADMGSPEEAKAAIAALHGTELGGRTIKVNDAKELEPRGGYERDYGGSSRGGSRGARW